MPEIPDLENILIFLNERLPGVRIDSVQPRIPIVIRYPAIDAFASKLEGQTLSVVNRRGKFLLFRTQSGDTLAVNPMLTGGFQYVTPDTKVHAKTCFTLKLENGMDLRYHDMRVMGKVYCVGPGEESIIPNFDRMGPDALDPELTLDVFRQRLRRYTGQIKRILVTDTFLAGIGNAYSDEILFDAGIYPFRRAQPSATMKSRPSTTACTPSWVKPRKSSASAWTAASTPRSGTSSRSTARGARTAPTAAAESARSRPTSA